MGFVVVLATLGAYGLAGWIWWYERTPNYLVALVASHLSVLLSPLWQQLYQFSFDRRFSSLYALFERPLPWVVFLGAWLFLLPSLVVFYLYQRRWWLPGYPSSLLAFVVFVGYCLLVETVGSRAGWWIYANTATLPLGLSLTWLSALMHALIGLGTLSVLIVTRRYAWLSLTLLLAPMPLLLSLVVNGLFGAPLYTVLLLRNWLLMDVESWAGTIGLLGTIGLVLAGAHTVASVIAAQPAGRAG